MNTKSLIAAAAIVALAPAAFAQSQPLSRAQIDADLKNPAIASFYGLDDALRPTPSAASTVTRAQVQAELAAARRAGPLAVEWTEAAPFVATAPKADSTLSRAEVRQAAQQVAHQQIDLYSPYAGS